MDNKILENKSRKMSKILRHNPFPLTMDDKGWIATGELCRHLDITLEDLDWIVENNDKKRFSLNDDKTNIRAVQGHSVGIAEDADYVRITALQVEMPLYHGTDYPTSQLIKNSTIQPGKRQYVHWTADIETAKKRASQRAYHNKTQPVLVILNARSYIHGKGKLLMAENGVYLTPEVDGKTLTIQPIQ